jgi:hypothetical protein
VSGFDGLPEIVAVEIDVGAGSDLGLLPDKAGLALEGLPVELDKLGFAPVVDEAVGVYTEAILMGVGNISEGHERKIVGIDPTMCL